MAKKISITFIALFSILFVAGICFGALQMGTLVDANGNPLEGFSNVYVENGKAFPVYNYNDGKWYSVIIIGYDENGNPICRLGLPMDPTKPGDPLKNEGGDGYEDDDIMDDVDLTNLSPTRLKS
jgi:hypothetical protein